MKARGFTLFEVLIALSMFVLALGGLAVALDKIVDASMFLREDAEIRRGLDSWADQAMVLPIATLEQGRESEPDPLGVTYSLSAEPAADFRNNKDEELGGLWWVTVRARWKDGDEEQTWEEKFLRYQP